jgi:hypothetical protein
MTAPHENSVLPLAQKLAAYPELWQVVSQQVRQPHYLANIVATLQPISIALFTQIKGEISSPPLGFLTGVLYFEIALALEPYTMALENLVQIFENEELATEGGALLAPGAPLAVAHRVMAEPIEAGTHSYIVLEFYAHVIAVCNGQRRFARRASRLAAQVKNWLRGKLFRNIPSLEQHRIAWDPDEVDHIQALAHWQRAMHASALGLSDSAQVDFAQCASIATAAQARRETLQWPGECLAAVRGAGRAAEGAGGNFTKAIGGSMRSIPVLPWVYRIYRQ